MTRIVIKCPYCGVGLIIERNGKYIISLLEINNNKLICGSCGRELPEDVRREIENLDILSVGDMHALIRVQNCSNVIIRDNEIINTWRRKEET